MFDFKKKNNVIIPQDRVLQSKYMENKDLYAFNIIQLMNEECNISSRTMLNNEYEELVNSFISELDEYVDQNVFSTNMFEMFYENDNYKKEFLNKVFSAQKMKIFIDRNTINGKVSVVFSSDAHFIVENNIIKKAVGIHSLLNSDFFTDKNFDNIFVGKSIEWAYELLKAMKVLNKSSELEDELHRYKLKRDIQDKFFESVIYKLLLDKSKNFEWQVKKATLVANYFGIDFNFYEYIRDTDIVKLRKC